MDGSSAAGRTNAHPERFSPNALLRPLYQESVLPNLAYIGGAAEVSYWAQLKGVFEASGLPMPVVFLRQSIQIISRSHARKMERLGWSALDLFRDRDELLREKVWDGSALQNSIQEAKESVGRWAKELEEVASAQGLEMKAAIEASLTRQQKELKRLEKKLLRSEKKRRAETVQAIEDLLNELFPGGKLQERQMNWIEAELLFGGGLVDELMKGIGPEGDRFACLYLKRLMEALLVLVPFAASLLTFFSGFGLGTLLTPVFVLFFPVELALLMTASVHLTNNVFKFALLICSVERKTLFSFALWAVPGAFLGAWTTVGLGQMRAWHFTETWTVGPLPFLIGCLMIVFTLMEFWPAWNRFAWTGRWFYTGGFFSGFFGGLSGHQGALRSLFLKSSICRPCHLWPLERPLQCSSI